MQSILERFDENSIQWIEDTITSTPDISRNRLAKLVCEQYDWRAPDGRLQTTSCSIGLRRLHDLELLDLPEPRYTPLANSIKNDAVEQPYDHPSLDCQIAELGEIRIVMINGDKENLQLWRQMMDSYHPQKSGRLCGAQIRYLIESTEAGYLGGLAFSSAAWRLAARDQWIGWTDSTRAENLGSVVNNSRFLILPQIRVPNLASKVLGLAQRQLVEDWYALYGVRPVLLETFVDPAYYRATCYRGANWRRIGKTTGRGRQDTGDLTKPKDIYCLPLCPDFREILGGEEPTFSDWAEEEFGRVDLGDARLRDRLMTLARSFYKNPLANIPEACGTPAATRAAYRFFKHPAVSMENTFSGHYEATTERIRQHKGVILAAQDSTSLNYHAHPAKKELGHIDAKGTRGLMVHDTMAFTTEGVPLGLIDVQCWAREEKKNRTVSESEKWLKSFEATEKVKRTCSRSKLIVSVGDREADFYDLFTSVRPDGAQLLVRAMHLRKLADDDTDIWIHMQRHPVAGTITVEIPPRPGQSKRKAVVNVHFDQVTILPPKNKSDLPPVTMWAVFAKETDPPKDIEEPLEWLLLTTVAVDDFESACERISWYTRRWGIEIFHKTLKSGCKIEKRQLGTAERISSCLALDMVVAWRVYYLTKQGRETPDVPCSVFFEENEWKALVAYVNKTPSDEPPTLSEAMYMVAGLGGYLGRKNDDPPGTTVIWRGLTALGWIKAAWLAFTSGKAPP